VHPCVLQGCVCSRFCYNRRMASTPMPIRLDDELIELLSEGARRTRQNKQTLVRLTLRRHLSEVIERESRKWPLNRITRLAPWPRGALAKAYKQAGKSSDGLEAAAVAAQGRPSWED